MIFGGCPLRVDAVYALSIPVDNRRYWAMSLDFRREWRATRNRNAPLFAAFGDSASPAAAQVPGGAFPRGGAEDEK
jgi:hypothetical protein